MQDEDYLVQHKIPHLIDELLLDLVKERPTDVVGYLIDWLAAKKGRRFIVGGNWKCNGTRKMIADLCQELGKGESVAGKNVEVVMGCPYLFADYTRKHLRSDWGVALQNCWVGKGGAFTGEISAEMIRDIGVEWVILGHSERRNLPQLKETDETVAVKCKYAINAGLKVMFCCGELLEEREAGKTMAVNERQCAALAAKLDPPDWEKVVIAYEPVWAIGTGKVASPEQAQEVHQNLRAWLAKAVSPKVAAATRIMYGGSVTDKNCEELARQPDIDGFLVGGASLKADFLKIVAAYKAK
eukprot:EG_transcript_18179